MPSPSSSLNALTPVTLHSPNASSSSSVLWSPSPSLSSSPSSSSASTTIITAQPLLHPNALVILTAPKSFGEYVSDHGGFVAGVLSFVLVPCIIAIGCWVARRYVTNLRKQRAAQAAKKRADEVYQYTNSQHDAGALTGATDFMPGTPESMHASPPGPPPFEPVFIDPVYLPVDAYVGVKAKSINF